MKLDSIIERAAWNIRRAHCQPRFFFDPNELIRPLNLEFVELFNPPFPCRTYDRFGRKKIFLDQDFEESKKRFAICHAVGHICLDHGDQSCGPSAFDPDKAGYSCAEATYFAAALLVPGGYLISMVNETHLTVDEMAATFGVSRALIEFRLKIFGI